MLQVLEGKPQYVEMAGNLTPVTKTGDQLSINFHAFRENRLPMIVRVRDSNQEPVGRLAFMREPRVARGEAPQNPICNLNVRLPDTIRVRAALQSLGTRVNESFRAALHHARQIFDLEHPLFCTLSGVLGLALISDTSSFHVQGEPVIEMDDAMVQQWQKKFDAQRGPTDESISKAELRLTDIADTVQGAYASTDSY